MMIEKLRLSTTTTLLSEEEMSLLYHQFHVFTELVIPNFSNSIVNIQVGQKIARNVFLRELVDNLYSRTTRINRGNFRVVGDTVDIHLAYADFGLRISFWVMKLMELG